MLVARKTGRVMPSSMREGKGKSRQHEAGGFRGVTSLKSGEAGRKSRLRVICDAAGTLTSGGNSEWDLTGSSRHTVKTDVTGRRRDWFDGRKRAGIESEQDSSCVTSSCVDEDRAAVDRCRWYACCPTEYVRSPQPSDEASQEKPVTVAGSVRQAEENG
jgi:hypothetical protein